MLTLAPAPTPAPDAFAGIRADIKRLTKQSDALRDQILADREIRVGTTHFATVSDRQRVTIDWQGLARSKSVTEAEIAAYTKPAWPAEQAEGVV